MDQSNSDFEYPKSLSLHEALPDEAKPREKLERYGAATLADSELLAIIIGHGVKGHNVKQVSELLLECFDGIGGLAKRNLDDLRSANIPGIKNVKAIEIAAVLELGKRIAETYVNEQKSESLSSPGQVFKVMWPKVRHAMQESFWVLHLNTKNKLVGEPVEVTRGLVNATQIHAREIFNKAIVRNATAVIFVHNHPSGDTTPSDDDIRATRQLIEASKIIGIRVLDHIIIGVSSDDPDHRYCSMRERNIVKF